MSAARDRIFAAIRSALGEERMTAEQIAAQAAALTRETGGVQPDFGTDDLTARFIAKATSERVTATVARVASRDAVPDAVRAYLSETGLAPRIALQPDPALVALDWREIETHDTPTPDEPAAVTRAEFGIAETGSLVFRSSPQSPVLHHFLPLHSIVALDTGAILAYPEDLWRAIAGDPVPRSLNIITGTSGTADIEAKNVRGAHGPRHMRIILID